VLVFKREMRGLTTRLIEDWTLRFTDYQKGQDNGTDAPLLLYGYLSAVLLAVALL